MSNVHEGVIAFLHHEGVLFGEGGMLENGARITHIFRALCHPMEASEGLRRHGKEGASLPCLKELSQDSKRCHPTSRGRNSP